MKKSLIASHPSKETATGQRPESLYGNLKHKFSLFILFTFVLFLCFCIGGNAIKEMGRVA